jgi:predicted AlkP superfamily phosphohydrolase/phosphomutase
MTNTRKVLALGIDAASPELLQQWAADGTMPTLGALIDRGVVAQLRNSAGLFNGSAWPNFYTGRNPGEHGIYWLERLTPGTYRIGPAEDEEFARHPPLWEILAAAGHRVMVLDVPVCRLSPGLNGVQVLEWGTHDRLFGHRTTPPSLTERIRQRVGAHPLRDPCDQLDRTPADYRAFADQLIRGTEARATMAVDLLRAEEWDFAIQVFSEAHCAGHQLWHYHDRDHPGADAAAVTEQGNLLREVYGAVDAAIARILDVVTPDTTVIVFSLHGMAALAGRSRALAKVLVQLGVMTRPTDASTAAAAAAPSGWRGRLKHAYRRLPNWIRMPVYRTREAMAGQRTGASKSINLDPERSSCFPVEIGPMVGAIRLNIRGREPAGILSPGDEATAFCERLTQDLLQLTDPVTGRPAVQRVLRIGDICHGPQLDRLPDLLVEWDLESSFGSTRAGNGQGGMVRVDSPRAGPVEVINTESRTGEHRMHGLLVARGPGLVPSRLNHDISVHDLAPTMARMMGCEMQTDDGEVVRELLG